MVAPSANETTKPQVVPGGKPKRHVRNYLLDARFQLRYASLLAGVATLVFAVLGVVIVRTGRITADVSNQAVDLAGVAADQSERARQESQSSARILQLQRLAETADPSVSRAMAAELEVIDGQGRASLQAVQRQREQARVKRAEIERLRKRIVWAVLLAGLAMAVALFAVGIVLSHRIVGPSYRLRQLCWKVSRGDLEITERLRAGDELVDVFEAFTAMVSSLRAQQATDLVGLDAALEALAKDHPDEAAVAKLRAAIDRMRKRRGDQDRVSFTPDVPAA